MSMLVRWVGDREHGPIGPGLCQSCLDLGCKSDTMKCDVQGDVKKHFLFSMLETKLETKKVCILVVWVCDQQRGPVIQRNYHNGQGL